jgi:tetratricopeptide (TPR) repeat protein
MIPQPVHKLDEISKKFVGLRLDSELNLFELNGWKRTILDLESWQNDPVAHYLLSIIYSFEGKEREFRTHSNHALELTNHDYQVYLARGSSLMWFGYLEESIKAFKTAWEINNVSVRANTDYAAILMKAGMISECVVILKHLDKIIPEENVLKNKIFKIQGYVDQLGISDEHIINLTRQAWKACQQHGGRLSGGDIDLLEDNEDKWVNIRLQLAKTVEEVRIVEQYWFTWLATSDLDPVLDKYITIDFEPTRLV